MTKNFGKSAIAMLITFGLLFTAAAPSAMAYGKKKKKKRAKVVRVYRDRDNYGERGYRNNYATRYSNQNRDRRYRNDRNRYDRNRYDDDYYRDRYDREDTKGKALKRTGIGAGVGALAGALIGGKKGALIGAGIGAAGGYIYHKKKVNDRRDRRGRRW